jgi:hypothetical protein
LKDIALINYQLSFFFIYFTKGFRKNSERIPTTEFPKQFPKGIPKGISKTDSKRILERIPERIPTHASTKTPDMTVSKVAKGTPLTSF